ncbi:DUF309 domain-containing protein [Bacillus carboniphilus]|uniref:DUF309 domain-containing protein n=1 Tax=Bacillus carboniphilus TaxID=86663 RepID=A0ABY9JZM5_9BACI|nr:DUF309 domain-containing protein [Bacillus carboniphilus]WLR43788.1 DUF309 domain-containing protein [Bacillus carboniphilus]
MYPKAFIEYLVQFHAKRDYFECHEILEEYWKEKNSSERDHFWVGFIQLAVGLYHQRRNNFSGSERMMKSCYHIFKNNLGTVEKLGVDSSNLLSSIVTRIHDVEQRKMYKRFDIPIKDHSLKAEAKEHANEMGLVWGIDSDLNDLEVIHRHTLRDRSDVIAERELALKKRRDRT